MMRKTVKTALLFSSVALIVACGGNNKKSENVMIDKNADKGIVLAEMDTTVRPQDDFYNYVNGTWAKTAKIPADNLRGALFISYARKPMRIACLSWIISLRKTSLKVLKVRK